MPSTRLINAWLLTVSVFLAGSVVAAQSVDEQGRVIDAVRSMYAAAASDDLAGFHAVTSPEVRVDGQTARITYVNSTRVPTQEREREENVTHNGLVTVASAYPVAETINRLRAIVEAAGFTVFARIDHAANAA